MKALRILRKIGLIVFFVILGTILTFGAWTAPRTWVANEIVTAALMNTHVRDNLLYLKGITDTTGYMLRLNGAVNRDCGLDPADSSTYYMGGELPYCGVTTSATFEKLFIPITGRITTTYVTVRVQGTLGSSETSSMWLRKNNSSDTLISSSFVFNVADSAAFSNAALNIAVTAGDNITLKWTTPAWATNPTTIGIWADIFVTTGS